MFRPIEKTARTSFVSRQDPAIDWEAMVTVELADNDEIPKGDDAERYDFAETLVVTKLAAAARKHPADAEGLMLFKDGQQPARFVLGVIPTTDMNRIQDECQQKPMALRWRAFLAAVSGIENWATPPKMNGDDRLDSGWASDTFIMGLRTVALEVGMVALMWNTLTEEEAKK